MRRLVLVALAVSFWSSGCSGGDDAVSTGTSTGGSSTTAAAVAPCEDPQPIMQAYTDPPAPSGFVRCASGMIHREAAVECAVPQVPSTCVDNGDGGPCMTNAECPGTYGQCVQVNTVNITCNCVNGCERDEDCPSGQICRCAGEGLGAYATCIPAACADDAACGEGLCAFAWFADQGVSASACQTPGDLCESSAACDAGKSEYCAYSGSSQRWECSPAPGA
ncbi:MAG TPA: hypothetical protein PKW35_07175 [Nannocystaceae bacterium]|nr:hypothetical protein [Nannocystaceae bacterium]